MMLFKITLLVLNIFIGVSDYDGFESYLKLPGACINTAAELLISE